MNRVTIVAVLLALALGAPELSHAAGSSDPQAALFGGGGAPRKKVKRTPVDYGKFKPRSTAIRGSPAAPSPRPSEGNPISAKGDGSKDAIPPPGNGPSPLPGGSEPGVEIETEPKASTGTPTSTDDEESSIYREIHSLSKEKLDKIRAAWKQGKRPRMVAERRKDASGKMQVKYRFAVRILAENKDEGAVEFGPETEWMTPIVD